MVLNPNCVRDILLTIENFKSPISMNKFDFFPLLPNYSRDELEYCCIKLYEGGYLHIYLTQNVPGYELHSLERIQDLTYQGHEFLENIRKPDIWNKVSPIFKHIGVSSLSAINSVASTMLLEFIKTSINA